jgi:ER membrane protein complex subunit 4
MQAFMLYMSGGGVQVFSMGIVFVLLLTPFKNIAAMNQGVSLPPLIYRLLMTVF